MRELSLSVISSSSSFRKYSEQRRKWKMEGLGELHRRYVCTHADYRFITAFARKGNASTAIAGIFSGPLITFLLGFGVSCLTQSFDG